VLLARTATLVAQAQLDLKASPVLLVTTALLAKTAKMVTPVDPVFQERMASLDHLATLVIYNPLSISSMGINLT